MSNRDTHAKERWHEEPCREHGHVTIMTQANPKGCQYIPDARRSKQASIISYLQSVTMATPNLACQPPDTRQYISTISGHPVCSPWYGSRGNLIDTPAYMTFKGLLQWSQKPDSANPLPLPLELPVCPPCERGDLKPRVR